MSKEPKKADLKNVISQVLVKETPRYSVWKITSLIGFQAEVLSGGDDPEETARFAQDINAHCEPQPVTVELSYTPGGERIGDVSMAEFLCDEKGIVPECQPGRRVCNIGFCETEQKWYGWSHRALFGFSVGDEVKEEDCTAISGWTDDYLAEHPEKDVSLPVGFKAETLKHAKKMAIAFAESVS